MRKPETIETEPLIHPNHTVLMLCVGKEAGSKKEIRALAEKRDLTRWHRYVFRLLEQGTVLRYIPELLGHKSSKTKENYTHVSQAAVQCIQSSLENECPRNRKRPHENMRQYSRDRADWRSISGKSFFY